MHAQGDIYGARPPYSLSLSPRYIFIYVKSRGGGERARREAPDISWGEGGFGRAHLRFMAVSFSVLRRSRRGKSFNEPFADRRKNNIDTSSRPAANSFLSPSLPSLPPPPLRYNYSLSLVAIDQKFHVKSRARAH